MRWRMDRQTARSLLLITAVLWGVVVVTSGLWTLLVGWGFWQRFGYAAVIVGCLTLLGSSGAMSWAVRNRTASATGRLSEVERDAEPTLGLTGTGIAVIVGLPMALLGGMIVS
jgi:hypothetical protein